MIRIAVVEDNPDLLDEVVFQMQAMGHAALGFGSGAALDQHLREHEVDLLVLDLGLPGEDGISVARRLRLSRPRLGIVMLTARGLLEDRLLGLDSGADVYLVKPVDMRELSAVCESLYRRLNRTVAPERPTVGWQLDGQTLELTPPKGPPIPLTPTEFKLMRRLAEAAPEPVTRAELAEAMGHAELDFDFRRLEAALSRLRRKIEMHTGADASSLRSARNVGYVFAAPIRIWPETS